MIKNVYLGIISCLFCLLASQFFSCKSVPFQPSNYQNDYLTFGSGGGFAGIETRYHLLRTGEVYKQTGQDTVLTQQKKLGRNLASQTLENCRVFGLDAYQYNAPGNTYRFLEVHLEGKNNRIVWSRDDPKVQASCKQIYQSLNTLVNAQ